MSNEVKKIVICSAAGDDQKAQISRMLLENHAGDVVGALESEAQAIAADEIYMYIPQDFTAAIEAAKIAIASKNINIVTGEDSPVCRDKTALISSFNGKVVRPYFIEDQETFCGYEGTAKHIYTVEALYRKLPENQGKKILYVTGAINNEGFIEADFGITLAQLLEMSGGVKDGSKLKAVLVGGELGAYIAADALESTLLTEDSDIFTGIIEVIDQSYCAVDKTKQLLASAREDSCGKCPLCREGSYQLHTIFNDISNGKAKPTDMALLADLTETIEIGAFCQFGRHMVKTVSTALAVMGSEIEGHIKRKKCEAGVCKRFLTFAILPDQCTGCEDCLDACEEDAIEGKSGYIHMIDDDLCEKCGKCIEVCEEDAIIIVGNVKPKLPKRLTRVGRFR